MSINFTSDAEIDRLLSLRAASRIPFPPEIALADPDRSDRFFRIRGIYDAYGLSTHPLVALLERSRVDAMTARSLAGASHLDRISHLSAWMGEDRVTFVDLTAPTRDDPKVRGRASRHGGSP